MGHSLPKNIDGFFACATEKAFTEKDGRSITVSSFAALCGVSRRTIYTWLKNISEIKRTTLQHKLKDNDPGGELAREVEKYYQLRDARLRSKNMADFHQIHRTLDGIVKGKFRSTKKLDDWIENY